MARELLDCYSIVESAGQHATELTFKDSTDLGGYDTWGRIKTMRHYNVSDSSNIARYEYGYDYASNPLSTVLRRTRRTSRTYQEDQLNASQMDELYGYDTLHRLSAFDRSDLIANDGNNRESPFLRCVRASCASAPGCPSRCVSAASVSAYGRG